MGVTVTSLLAGDVMTGRGIDQILGQPGDPTLYEAHVRDARDYVALAERVFGDLPRGVTPGYVWGELLPFLQAEAIDVTIVNLETAITDGGSPWPGKGIHYRMHPDNVSSLRAASIDVTNLANNHALDWSHQGLSQTLDTLKGAGIAVCGAGADVGARTPAVVGLEGDRRVVVLGIGVTSSGIPLEWRATKTRSGLFVVDQLSDNTVDDVATLLGGIVTPSDLVVVSVHWGGNWGYPIPEAHRRFAHGLIDRAGVHVVHGHSSHHPLGIEVYRGAPILYGCGDLINDYEGIGGQERYRSDLGALYQVTIDLTSGALTRLELVPTRMRRFRLQNASSEEQSWLARKLSSESSRFGVHVEEGPNGGLVVRW